MALARPLRLAGLACNYILGSLAEIVPLSSQSELDFRCPNGERNRFKLFGFKTNPSI
jgi:hypothetical protein